MVKGVEKGVTGIEGKVPLFRRERQFAWTLIPLCSCFWYQCCQHNAVTAVRCKPGCKVLPGYPVLDNRLTFTT